MIIDCHTHLQKHVTFENIISILNKYQIDITIISILGNFENGSQLLNQNNLILDLYNKSPRIRGTFFINPNIKISETIKNYILQNRQCFLGLKYHSHISSLSICDEKNYPYYEFASKYDFPVLFHTDGSLLCNANEIERIAILYPSLKIIMGHMEILSDHKKSIEIINKYSNIYGDTSWIEYNQVIEILKNTPQNKIMFGTDAPFDGELGFGEQLDEKRCNFKWYSHQLDNLKEDIDDNELLSNYYYYNSLKIFNCL